MQLGSHKPSFCAFARVCVNLRLGRVTLDGESKVRNQSGEPSFMILFKYDVVELDVTVSHVLTDM